MGNAVLAAASLVIALAAVAVAIWQVRMSARATERTNSLPIMSAAFDEFRSADFQGHLRRVWNEAPAEVPQDGFQALPDEWRGSAYRVAYFFEYLGLLVAYELAPRDSIIDFSANLVVRSWNALAPFIEAERQYRRRTGGGVSSGFVSHFEHLVVLTMGENGTPVDSEIHEKLSLKRVSATDTAESSTEARAERRTKAFDVLARPHVPGGRRGGSARPSQSPQESSR